MIIDRIQGVLTITMVLQMALVTLVYWLWYVIYPFDVVVGSDLVGNYLPYNVFLLSGLGFWRLTRQDLDNFDNHNFSSASRQAMQQMVSALFFLGLYLIALKDKGISRLFLFSFVPVLYLTLVLSTRYLPNWVQKAVFKGRREERLLLVGPVSAAVELKDWLAKKEALGFRMIGLVCDAGTVAATSGLRILGGLSDLNQVIQEQRITKVLIVGLSTLPPILGDLIDTCERQGIGFLVVSDLDQQFRHPVTIFRNESVLFISPSEEPLENPFNRLLKRALDLAVSLAVVVFILPFTTALVWLMHRLQSPGPILFLQERSGLRNIPFFIRKYRTMHVNHGHDARQARCDDPRVFPAGRWLRKSSIDELPQFLNVLRGEMSVVGPRPHLVEHNHLFARVLRNYHVRARVKPGITGLAQVRGFRGEAHTEKDIANRLASDLHYLQNWSLLVDVGIMLRTAWQVIFPPKSAY